MRNRFIHNSNQTAGMALNTVLRTDPTRTKTIRKRFLAAVNRRFKTLQNEITTSIVTNDGFGLSASTPEALRINAAAGVGAFNFPTDVEKIEAFMSWLKESEATNVLELIDQPLIMPIGTGAAPWANTFIHSAYQKGMLRARTELIKAGVDIPTFAETSGGISAAFNTPIHAERLAMAYLRTFQELNGITAAMDQQISRVLAEGLADGSGTAQIARNINDRVQKIGRTRARTLARTEVIRAHHKANIAEYRGAGILNIKVKVEWLTAGFNVCPDCASLGGRIFTIDEIENLIPLHSNCRCIALPLTEGSLPEAFEDSPIRRTSDIVSSSIGEQYRSADGNFYRTGFIERQQGRGRPSRKRRKVRE